MVEITGKRKKKIKADDNPPLSRSESDDDSANYRYKPFKIENHSCQYPEDGGNFEYLVIYESNDSSKPIGDRDLMSLGAVLKRQHKGIKRFKPIYRYKIAVIFERPGLANMALNNNKIQRFRYKSHNSGEAY